MWTRSYVRSKPECPIALLRPGERRRRENELNGNSHFTPGPAGWKEFTISLGVPCDNSLEPRHFQSGIGLTLKLDAGEERPPRAHKSPFTGLIQSARQLPT